ncbi:MAG: hypothetical protein ABL998_17785 [Planctomycetota bacterium]
MVVPLTAECPRPSAITGSHYDLQGVMTHEYGHALGLEVVVPAAPRLELASGDAGVIVPRGQDLRVRLAGTPGSRQLLLVSPSAQASVSPLVTLGLGANFTQLTLVGSFTIPAESWLEFSLSNLPDPGPTGQAWFAQVVEFGTSRPLPSSEVQSLRLVR